MIFVSTNIDEQSLLRLHKDEKLKLGWKRLYYIRE